MATAISIPVSPDFAILDGDADFTEFVAVYEPIAASIGVGSNTPYVALHGRIQSNSGTIVQANIGTNGSHRFVSTYTDGSQENHSSDDSPLSAVTNLSTTNRWFTLYADGKWRQRNTNATPTASDDGTANASASSRSRFALNSSKTPDRIRYYWTDDS